MGIILYIYIHIFTNMQTCQTYPLWLFAKKIASCQDNPFTAISSDPETSSSEKGDRTDGYRDDKRCTGPPVMTAKAKRWSRWGWPVGHDLFPWTHRWQKIMSSWWFCRQVPEAGVMDKPNCHHYYLLFRDSYTATATIRWFLVDDDPWVKTLPFQLWAAAAADFNMKLYHQALRSHKSDVWLVSGLAAERLLSGFQLQKVEAKKKELMAAFLIGARNEHVGTLRYACWLKCEIAFRS